MSFKIISNLSSGDLSVSINVSAPRSSTAPASYKFTATFPENIMREPSTGTYASYTDLNFLLAEYFWVFSSTETGNWDAPEYFASANNIAKNKGVGRSCMKCFETPGSHAVTVLVVFPDGRSGIAQTTVQIGDPDADFTSAQTVVFSPNGDFTGAPTHNPANEVTTWAQLKALYGNFSEPKMRVLFDESQSVNLSGFDTNDKFSTVDNTSVKELHFATWTRGQQVLWDFPDQTATVFACKVSDATFKLEDIYFRGRYNMTTETGNRLGKVISEEETTEIVVHNCRDEGTAIFAQLSNGAIGGRMHVNNHYRTEFGNYFCLWSRVAGDFAVTGSSHVATYTGASGGRSKLDDPGARNEHNFVRAAGELVYIYGNEVFAKHGWSGGTSLTINPPSRFGRNNPAYMELVVACNVYEGKITYQLDDQQGNYNPRLGLIERNYFLISTLERLAVGAINGQLAIRNNICVNPSGIGGWRAPFSVASYRVPTEGFDEPIFVYGNTIVDLSDDATVDDGTKTFHMANGVGLFNHIEEANNHIYRPNTTTQINPDTLDTTPLSWSSRMGPVLLNWLAIEKGDFPVPSDITGGSGSFDIPYIPNWKSYAPREGGGGVQMTQADFSGINQNPTYHKFTTEFSMADTSGDISIAVDTPSVGQVTITNNSGSSWGAGSTFRLFFAPVGETSPRVAVISGTASAVSGSGGTIVVDNPSGFTPASENYVLLQKEMTSGEYTLTAGATALSISSDAVGNDWPAGTSFFLQIDTGDNPPPLMPEFAHPEGTVSLYRPLSPLTADADLRPIFDFEGLPRVGGVHPDAVAGTFTAGAIEVI